MSWTLLSVLAFVLGLALLAARQRRAELVRMEQAVAARERAVRQGSDKAQLQHPVVDLSRCLGCGTCVAACPEDGVLDLVHGQAVVVNGARCVGHAMCERECPVGAITVTLADLEDRRDVPALTPDLEAVGSPGLFLAGEVTAHALIKTAVQHGVAVGAEVARRVEEADADEGVEPEVLDLCIVGAGPAGLACALESKRLGLEFVALEQEDAVGGTVARYPRRKLVMTEPVELPLYGRLRKNTYTKEELVELWQGVASEQQLPIVTGAVFAGLEWDERGHYLVRTATRSYVARHVCLALGRRGVPRKLGVPGEDQPKVAYSLLDASSYRGRRILVVGGGDSAVEAAMGLAEQPDNEVVLSYRKESFFRVRARNEERLAECVARGDLRVIYQSEVRAIHRDSVELEVAAARREHVLDTQPSPAGSNAPHRAAESVHPGGDGGPALAAPTVPAASSAGGGPATQRLILPNDEVFVMAGGIAPVELLERSGVSFDPEMRGPAPALGEQGTGLLRALEIGLVLTLVTLAWALWNADYYLLPDALRATHDKHAALRPGLGVGLALGVASALMIVINLLYLVRRTPAFRFRLGSLRAWMTSHVATGILALLCATLHGAMQPSDTPGGHALWALVVLLVSGAIGRYFYAYVPRAANGRELELAEVRAALQQVSSEWGGIASEFPRRVRDEVEGLVERRQWRGTFAGRVLALLGAQRDLRRALGRLAHDGRQAGVPDEQVRDTLRLARRAHRAALMAAYHEDLRGLLSTWRYVHRWVALLLVLLIVVHVVHAVNYGALLFDGGSR